MNKNPRQSAKNHFGNLSEKTERIKGLEFVFDI
jgi:hypothetical protein